MQILSIPNKNHLDKPRFHRLKWCYHPKNIHESVHDHSKIHESMHFGEDKVVSPLSALDDDDDD